MQPKKSLQKLTETDCKINKIISLKVITPNDISTLSKTETSRLYEILTEKLSKLKGEERDKFYRKFAPITGQATKNQLWEYNHNKITQSISMLMYEYGRMPTTSEIADHSELSRQTIHKHMKEYTTHPLYVEFLEQFRFMSTKVLAKVYQFALQGDTGAAKLYFSIIGAVNNGQAQNNTLIQNQNNYIQINGTVLSQETIKNLSAEQLQNIEAIIKAPMPKKEQGNN